MNIISSAVCEKWFKRFMNDDYDVTPRSGHPNEMQNNELEILLNENSAQMLKDLAGQLGIG